MKRCLGVLFSAISLVAVSASGELMYEFFDDFPMGSITNNNDWFARAGDLSGVVTNTRPFSASQSVMLPYPPGTPGATGSSMVFITGDAYNWSSADHSVIRISARIYCERANQTIAMIAEHDSDHKLNVLFDATDGHIKMNGTDTGAGFITGNYAELVLYYNMVANTASLDYNGTNIQAWVSLGGSASTQFNKIGFYRNTSGGGADGAVYIDDVMVEVFPSSTIAWWRFEEGDGKRTAERTGRYPAVDCWASFGRDWAEAAVDLLYNGRKDVPDLGAFNGPRTGTATNGLGRFIMTNWTFEAVVKIMPDVESYGANFMDAAVGYGFNSTNSCIHVYAGSQTNLWIVLRDNKQTAIVSQNIESIETIPMDGEWHHLGVVKTNDILLIYIDYKPISTNSLYSAADGAYEFGPESCASIGIGLNGAGAADAGFFFDEVRLSCGVLKTRKFIQSSRPIMEDSEKNPEAATWEYRFMTIPGFDYHIQYNSALDTTEWITYPPAMRAVDHSSVMTIPRRVFDNAFIRIVREK